jgi:hypothetical protein
MQIIIIQSVKATIYSSGGDGRWEGAEENPYNSFNAQSVSISHMIRTSYTIRISYNILYIHLDSNDSDNWRGDRHS